MTPDQDASNAGKPTRLVTFLGTGNYHETTYAWSREDEKTGEYRTKYVAEALCVMAPATEVVVLATKEAWDKHGEGLSIQLANTSLLKTDSVRTPDQDGFFPTGGEQGVLWEQFAFVKEALRPAAGTEILLDITHGFRSFPFFAAAVVGFTRLLDPNPPDVRVVYGALEGGDGTTTPIWDLTPFIELLDWSRNLMLFLQTGRSADLATKTHNLGKALGRAWAAGGKQGSRPQIQKLAAALKRFGGDIETVRTGSLLLGKQGEKSGVAEILDALDHSQDELLEHIPPLADVLARIREKVEPLRTDQRLSSPDGLRALKALASFYLEMGRYAEAAATIREAWITQHACSKSDCPGHDEFSKQHRDAAEVAWRDANEQLVAEIAETRNDIQHAGYRRHPQPPETIKNKIKELIDKFEPGTDGSDA